MQRSLYIVVLLAIGCAGRTEIVVEVDSDLDVPGEIDVIQVIVTGSQTMTASGSLRDRGLPRTVGLVPAGDSLGPIEIRAVGLLDGTPVVEQIAITSFLSGRTLHLPMFLSRSCRGMTSCLEGETCDRGGCISSSVDPNTLDDWRDVDAARPRRDAGPDRVDAGVDAGTDAGSIDDAGMDAGPDLDAGMDAGPDLDAGSDAGMDAGGDAGGARTCDDIYGGLACYQLCAETAAQCEFFTVLGGNNSCTDFCTSVGGTCIETYSESAADDCVRTGAARPCATDRNDEICVCTRVP